MALPDGSMALICPVGPEWSQVSDTDFDAWVANESIYIEEITDMALFGLWFSNIKRVTTAYLVEYTDSTPDYLVESNGVQWRVVDYAPVEANTGDHPYPRTVHNGDGLIALSDMEEFFRYANEEWPTDAYNTGMPYFFVHKDKFYIKYFIELPSADFPYEIELTEEYFRVTYTNATSSSIVTITYTITIDQLFYP